MATRVVTALCGACLVMATGACEPASARTTAPASSRRVRAQPQASAVATEPAAPTTFVLADARWPGGEAVSLEIRDGRIVSVDPGPRDGPPRVDAQGRFLVPAVIDSHVHLSFRFGLRGRDAGAQQLAAAGLGAVVDLAAPVQTLGEAAAPLRVLAAGPILAAPGGYPTRHWGRDGYGQEHRGADTLREAVRQLHESGAGVIKLALHGPPSLDRTELRAVVEQAHASGLKVAVHALSDAEARLAAEIGADVLAHTPIEPLRAVTVEAWSGRAVISTLAAFGGAPSAVDNLRALRDAGATVLYGTDLGNPGVLATGISQGELELMHAAGLDAAAILEASTEAPAAWWGLDALGRVEPGRAASLLLLDEDPSVDVTALARPAVVYLDGVRMPSAVEEP